jgi:hypothetical protein
VVVLNIYILTKIFFFYREKKIKKPKKQKIFLIFCFFCFLFQTAKNLGTGGLHELPASFIPDFILGIFFCFFLVSVSGENMNVHQKN